MHVDIGDESHENSHHYWLYCDYLRNIEDQFCVFGNDQEKETVLQNQASQVHRYDCLRTHSIRGVFMDKNATSRMLPAT